MSPYVLRNEPPEADGPLVLERFLPFRLALAAEAVSRLIARSAEDRFGLTPAAGRILLLLAEHGLLDDGGLERRAGLSAAETAAGLAVLIRRELAANALEPEGRTLTETGRRLASELASLAQAGEAALLSGLSPQEVNSVHQLIGRLEAAALKLSGKSRVHMLPNVADSQG